MYSAVVGVCYIHTAPGIIHSLRQEHRLLKLSASAVHGHIDLGSLR